MEKEFNLSEDVSVTATEEILEEKVDFDYSNISNDDYTTVNESEIDWSTL